MALLLGYVGNSNDHGASLLWRLEDGAFLSIRKQLPEATSRVNATGFQAGVHACRKRLDVEGLVRLPVYLAVAVDELMLQLTFKHKHRKVYFVPN